MEKIIAKWNGLSSDEKYRFGSNMMVSPRPNVETFIKPFNELSKWKQESVLKNLSI